MSDIESKLRERLERTVTEAPGHTSRGELVDAIMADVEVYGTLKAREGWNALRAAEALLYTTTPGQRRYPLPKRTRTVLREEPVPGRASPIYRWIGNRLEHSCGDAWTRCIISSWDIDLMRHAIDLADRPTRTVEMPVDEDDPWGEGGA